MKKTKTVDQSNFDDEEIEIIDAFESGKLKNSPVSKGIIIAAQETMKKNKNINIRITENDLVSIKMIAAREGLPYQTLIGSLIHKYASGYLREAI
jgi:predicted DNA binding CopG/RHH family protein